MSSLVIYHSADFDGIFCREIARLALGENAEYVGWDYGEPEPVVDPERRLYILDLSVPSLMSHPRLTWIDHHKTAIEQYPHTEGYQIDGVAACRLTWQWFFGTNTYERADYVARRVSEPLAVRLAGEYDIWDKRDPRVDLFQHGLRSRDLATSWGELLSPMADGEAIVAELLEAGKILEYARARENESIVKRQAFTVRFEGFTFLALNAARCNSLTFLPGLQPEHDGCLAFAWTGSDWRVSLYGVPGKPELDFSGIAMRYGGGGHRQACGFRTATLPFLQAGDDGATLIARERARQITVEGFTPEHDDAHDRGQLTDAAMCYNLAADGMSLRGWCVERARAEMLGFCWPWEAEWCKPAETARGNYVKAGALIAAEIDRLKRRAVA